MFYPHGCKHIIFTKDYIYIAYKQQIDVWSTSVGLLQRYYLSSIENISLFPNNDKLFVLCGRHILVYDINQQKRIKRVRLSFLPNCVRASLQDDDTINIDLPNKRKSYSMVDNLYI